MVRAASASSLISSRLVESGTAAERLPSARARMVPVMALIGRIIPRPMIREAMIPIRIAASPAPMIPVTEP